jgi:hypothetical protein
MESEAAHSAITLAIGGGVGTVCRIGMSAGLHGRWASVGAGVIAAIFVGIHGYDAGDFHRGNLMAYMLGYVETLTIALGAVKGLEVTQDKIQEMRSA